MSKLKLNCASAITMKMHGTNDEDKLPRIAEFYKGKSIFLTGAGGFLGSILLETLLRCCVGIKLIYILLRTKKNVHPEYRKEQIFNKKIFEKIQKENPELLKKVCVISGDVSLPNLGMNEDDTHLLLEEVSVVFHCAGETNFKKPLEFLLKNNVLSLNSVIELCRKMKKFKVLVYTSTAYSNCNHFNFSIKEDVYRLPFHAGKFLDALKNENKEKLQALVAHCKPDWPNMYCFSKCLAENLITDTASDLTIAVIRPSSVSSTWKQPFPGYAEDTSGVIALSLGVGKGIIKVFHGDRNSIQDYVPADIVANAHVLAAWSIGTNRCASPLIVNCTATKGLQVKICDYLETITQLVHEFPIPISFEQPSCPIIMPNKYIYFILEAYYHYLPMIVLDTMARISGKKSRIYSLYYFYAKLMRSLSFFMCHTFEFERNNLENLAKLVQNEGRKDLALDFKDATFPRMALSIPEGSPFYDWKIDQKSQSERQRIIHKRHILIGFIRGLFIMICSLFIYWAFCSTFR